jgi:NAD(P)-dependent dehydrogenase (short-subunit alcohol dehydrogenase family)
MTNETKVAIVTAAGRGMGAACARELAGQGYRLALMSPSGSAERLAIELGGVGYTGSVTKMEDLEVLVNRALDRFGRVDAVLNNTGHPPKGDLLQLTDADWHEGLEIVFLNVVRMARLVTPVMVKQGGGAIVNISTLGAVQPSVRYPVSSALRAGLAGFTKMYADQYASACIRMNNLLPGFIDSYPEEESIRATIPMGRYGTVTEIARTAAFLLSPAASYITGQNIRVDGGITRCP